MSMSSLFRAGDNLASEVYQSGALVLTPVRDEETEEERHEPRDDDAQGSADALTPIKV